MAGMNMTSRLEAKDNKIKGLKERITTLTTQLREAKAAGKTRRTAAAKPDASSSGKTRRPASSKARTRARTRSAAPAAA